MKTNIKEVNKRSLKHFYVQNLAEQREAVKITTTGEIHRWSYRMERSVLHPANAGKQRHTEGLTGRSWDKVEIWKSYGWCSGKRSLKCPVLHGARLNPQVSAVYATATQHQTRSSPDHLFSPSPSVSLQIQVMKQTWLRVCFLLEVSSYCARVLDLQYEAYPWNRQGWLREAFSFWFSGRS